MADDNILVCKTVADLEKAPGSVRGNHCRDCGVELWVRPKNLTLGFPLLCRSCSEMYAKECEARGEENTYHWAREAHARLAKGTQDTV